MTQKLLVSSVDSISTPTLRIFDLGGDTILQTAATPTAHSNALGDYLFTDVLESLVGYYRWVLLDGAFLSAKGYCDLTGIANALHIGEYDLAYLKILRWTTTNAVAVQIAAATSETTISWMRGDDVTQQLVLGDLTGWTKLIFTAKDGYDKTDAESEIRISHVSGGSTLDYIAGRAPVAGETGTIVIDDEATGTVTVGLDHDASSNLRLLKERGRFDVQVHKSTAITTPSGGRGVFAPVMDLTLAVA